MNALYLSYEDCRNMVSSFLSQQKNLRQFCNEKGLTKVDYNIALKIKGKTDKKPYPNFLITILGYMGFDAKKETFFCLTPKNE